MYAKGLSKKSAKIYATSAEASKNAAHMGLTAKTFVSPASKNQNTRRL